MLGMVSNLIAHLVELPNLLPGEIVLRVLEKAQSLGDIEGCSKSVLLEDLGDVGEVGLVAVVEGQGREIVRDWELLTGRLQFFGCRRVLLLCRGTPHQKHGCDCC